ncbi:phospholipid carrier-dependent glycosyltransferase [Kitasatospora saccharophila]|uniref:phospholipid carrier-dependent glycosyltransferase n=1 Tax=Kitasatospora saccharophila TaxID=407973 RepID=UPI003641A6E4
MIGLGTHFWGLHPFGWRIAVAVLGTLSVLMVARIGRRLFRSTLIGCVAGLLMAVDGLQFVMSRVGLLDGVSAFLVLGAFGALLVDRDRTRDLLRAARAEGGRAADEVRFGLRPWRLAAGVLLGAACAVKWTGAPALAVFTVLVLLWDQAGRRAAGARHPGGRCSGATCGPPPCRCRWPGCSPTCCPGPAGWPPTAATTGTGRTGAPGPSAGCRRRCAACGTTTRRSGTSTPP